MDFSLISSINVGSTSISSVYYQSQKIWPSLPDWFDKGDFIAFDVYATLDMDTYNPLHHEPNEGMLTEDQYKEILGYDPYKGYQHLYAVNGTNIPNNPMPEFVTTEYGNCVRYWVAKGVTSYIYISDADGDITFEKRVGIGTAAINDGDTQYMEELGWKWNGNNGGMLIGSFNVFDTDLYNTHPDRYTQSSTYNNQAYYTSYRHEDTNTKVQLCINKASKVSFPSQIMLNPAGTFGYAVKGSKDDSVTVGNMSNLPLDKSWFEQNCNLTDGYYQIDVCPRANDQLSTGERMFAFSSTDYEIESVNKIFPPSEGMFSCEAEMIGSVVRVTNTGADIPYGGEASQGMLAVFEVKFKNCNTSLRINMNYNFSMSPKHAPEFSEWQTMSSNGTATIEENTITITEFSGVDASPVYFTAKPSNEPYYLVINVSGLPSNATIYLDSYESSGMYRYNLKEGDNYAYCMYESSVNIGFRSTVALDSCNIKIQRLPTT